VSETASFIAPRPLTVKKTQFRQDHDGSFFMSTPQNDEKASEPSDRNTSSPWNPSLRRIMGSVATLGVLETSLLTYSKLSGPSIDICGTSGDCSSVLNGPYSVIPFTDIPLSAVGLGAYVFTALLALVPVLTNDSQDTNNRMALLSLTTAMGTFSVFLLSLIYGVLHTSCPYCLLSACCSITLAACAWIGGCLPEQEKKQQGVQAGIVSFLATTAMAVVFFGSVGDITPFPTMNSSRTSSSSLYFLASSSSSPKNEQGVLQSMSPPPITTTSSERALVLSDNLLLYNAKMYGAYWCSHCFDQKQAFGKKAFSQIQYIECSREGMNSQTSLCKEMDVPGYPTWEIDGKLYPGERDLEELEEILKVIQIKK
jgi:uncharacterized membrane protein